MDQPDWRKQLAHGAKRLRHAFRPTEGSRVTTPGERRRAFQILFGSLICLGMGQSIMFSVLPPVSRLLGISEFKVGLIFAFSAGIWIFSSPYWGVRSDFVGRRPIMLLGLVAFAVSTALFALVTGLGTSGIIGAGSAYVLMVAARALYGILGSGTYPAAQAYIADRTTREERTSGVATISAAFGLGVAVGPGFGSIFEFFGILAPFFAVAVLALLSSLAIYVWLPERTAPRQREALPRATLSWRDPRVLPYLIYGTALNSIGALPIQSFGFLVIDVLKRKPEEVTGEVGVGLMASSMAALFAQFVMVQRFRMSSRDLIRWGVIVGLASNLLFVFGSTYALLVSAMVLSGLGFGLARPGFAAASSLAVSPEEQGAIAGLTGATGGAGFIFAPIIGLGLYEVNPVAPFALGCAGMAVLLAIAYLNPTMRNITDALPEEAEEADDTGVPKS